MQYNLLSINFEGDIKSVLCTRSILTISTGGHHIHELGPSEVYVLTEVCTNQEYVPTRVLTIENCMV